MESEGTVEEKKTGHDSEEDDDDMPDLESVGSSEVRRSSSAVRRAGSSSCVLTLVCIDCHLSTYVSSSIQMKKKRALNQAKKRSSLGMKTMGTPLPNRKNQAVNKLPLKKQVLLHQLETGPYLRMTMTILT